MYDRIEQSMIDCSRLHLTYHVNVVMCIVWYPIAEQLSCPRQHSCPVLSCHVLSCADLPCPVLSYSVLSCPVLSCPVLSCPVLSCPVLSYSISVLLLSSILPLVFFPLLSLNSFFQILSWSFLSYSLLFSCLSIDLVSLYLILFHKSLGTIEDSSQLNFIYRGFVRLLNNVHLSESSYLPFSVARMSVEQVGDEEYSAGDSRIGFVCVVWVCVCLWGGS